MYRCVYHAALRYWWEIWHSFVSSLLRWMRIYSLRRSKAKIRARLWALFVSLRESIIPPDGFQDAAHDGKDRDDADSEQIVVLFRASGTIRTHRGFGYRTFPMEFYGAVFWDVHIGREAGSSCYLRASSTTANMPHHRAGGGGRIQLVWETRLASAAGWWGKKP
jgi:hypothetical protein